MNTFLLIAATLLSTAIVDQAETVTIVADASNPSGGLAKQIPPTVLEIDDFQVAELIPGGLPTGAGLVRYASEFASFGW